MKHAVVDKRIAGIVRWLERLKNSYSQGAMEIALMDAECARADLEDLRHDVFEKCAANARTHNFANYFSRALSVIFLAAVIVIFSVSPIARDSLAPFPVIAEEKNNNLVLAEPIIIVREEKSERPKISRPAPATAKRPVKSQPVKSIEKPVKASNLPASDKTAAINKKVPYDQVLSLMQTGQRALKNNNSVVTVK